MRTGFRATFLRALDRKLALSSDLFDAHDFSVTQGSSGGDPILNIRLRDEDSFQFSIKGVIGGFRVARSPGRTLTLENDNYSQPDDVLDEVARWVSAIAAEQRVQPSVKGMAELRARLDELESRMADVEDRSTTEQERRVLLDAVSRLEAAAEAQIRETIEARDAMQEQLDQLRSDVAALQEQVERLSIKRVLRKVFSTFGKWASSEPIQKSLTSVAEGVTRAALPPSSGS